MAELQGFPAGIGSDGMHLNTDNYKRAVYRPAPAEFVVDILPPKKQGSGYSYGMRIIPTGPVDDDWRSTFSSISGSDDYLKVEYDVYRRWEDCLIFQQTLESEYRNMAREKRKRLQAGKGVKKNGMYIHDQAASWESLPPGPDANTIAKDIHDILPRLTKKGTLFRASPQTINQRHKEMQALLSALFHKDMPTLIKELRTQSPVVDFFGYWRRDHDAFLKTRPPVEKIPRNSISSGIFTTYSVSSVSDVSSVSGTRSSIFGSRARSEVPQQVRERQLNPNLARKRRSYGSSGSSDGGSYRSSGDRRSSTSSDSSFTSVTTSSEIGAPSIVVSEAPSPKKHTSYSLSEFEFGDPTATVNDNLEALPEGSEYSFKLDEDSYIPVPIHMRRANSAGGRRSNRTCSIYSASSSSPVYTDEYESTADTSDHATIRESWQTTSTITGYLSNLNISLSDDNASISERSPQHRGSVASFSTVMTNDTAVAAILDGLDGSFHDSPTAEALPTRRRAPLRDSVATFMSDDSAFALLPRSPRPRDSMASVATFMTQCSADAVIPRSKERDSGEQYDDGYESERIESVLYDQFPMPWGISPADSRPETPVSIRPLNIRSKTEYVRPMVTPRKRSSTITSTSSSGTIPPPGMITIKAAYKDTVVILRGSRQTSFEELKQRLFAKFVKQEGMDLTETFFVGHVPAPASAEPASPVRPGTRRRTLSSSSIVSAATERSDVTANIVADPRQLVMITSQADWETAIASSQKSKLTLRVFSTTTVAR